MATLHQKGQDALAFIAAFLKWVGLAAAMGLVCGPAGAVFHHCIAWASSLRSQHDFVILLMPLGGVLIVFLYKLCRMEAGMGTNQVISSIRSKEKLPILMAPLIFIATVISQLVGASTGREGAALQVGGSIGSFLGRRLRLDIKDVHMLTLCGMSGVFAALFGTPLTATVFSIEVISIGVLHYAALIPCIVCSITAYQISTALGTAPTVFALDIPDFTALLSVKVIVLAALCAVLSILFCVLMKETQALAQKYLKNEYVRIAAGSAAVVAVTYLLHTRAFNGAGMEQITLAVAGKAGAFDFLFKMLLTSVSVAAGFKGGEIVPTLMIGATFGCVAGPLLGLPAGFAAAIGLICLFCSVVNCPIASIMLSIELFGTGEILLFAVACCVSYMLSGYYGLYSSQKIVYSKLTTEFVDRTAQ